MIEGKNDIGRIWAQDVKSDEMPPITFSDMLI